MFSLQKETGGEEGMEEDGEEDDNFQTDDEEEEMEVEKQAPQKRKKVCRFLFWESSFSNLADGCLCVRQSLVRVLWSLLVNLMIMKAGRALKVQDAGFTVWQ